jgi:hypothetical protein
VTRFALLLLCLVGCSVDDNTPPTCMTASTDTCTADNVCIGTACAPAFPHAYAITALSITAPNLKPNGDPWNTGPDGSPNLYADISVGGTLIVTTPINPMSYNATFPGPFMVNLDENATLDITASSKDDTTDDLVYDCSIPMVSALILRVRYELCSGAGVTMNYLIDPV